MNPLDIVFQAYFQAVSFDFFLAIMALVFILEFILTLTANFDVV